VNNDQWGEGRGERREEKQHLGNMAAVFLSGIELQPWLAHNGADGSNGVEVKLCFVLETHYRHANGQREASAPAVQAHPLRDAT
jgi:hypothetical protein